MQKKNDLNILKTSLNNNTLLLLKKKMSNNKLIYLETNNILNIIKHFPSANKE